MSNDQQKTTKCDPPEGYDQFALGAAVSQSITGEKTMPNEGYHLVDAQELAQWSQGRGLGTYQAPDPDDVANLAAGDLAYVFVQGPRAREMFWVTVTHPLRGGFYGRVQNDLLYTEHHGLKCGDPLAVSARHVVQMETKAEAQNVEAVIDAVETLNDLGLIIVEDAEQRVADETMVAGEQLTAAGGPIE